MQGMCSNSCTISVDSQLEKKFREVFLPIVLGGIGNVLGNAWVNSPDLMIQCLESCDMLLFWPSGFRGHL